MAQKFSNSALLPTQRKQWGMTKAALQWQAPGFTHLLYTMMNNSGSDNIAIFTSEVPIAATDGKALILNPEPFFKHTMGEQVFITAHEISHVMLNHICRAYQMQMQGKVCFSDGTTLPYDLETWNIATDLVINDMLIKSNIGTFNKAWLHDETLGTYKDNAVDVYRRVYQKSNSGGKPKGEQERFDEHLPPGTTESKTAFDAASERNEKEWSAAIAAAAAITKAQGKEGLGKVLSNFFNSTIQPQVEWADKIEAFFARKVGSGSYDWRRPDRRLIVRDIYAPGRSGHGAGTVVVAVDTSGSIIGDDTLLKRFFTEMASILDEVKPKRLMVMWIDAKVHSVEEIEEASDLRSLKPKGGGGTDFRPAFDWIAKEGLEPDALVFLTDGYGSFPTSAPSYPTLWGNVSPELKDTHYPFGEVVTVPVVKKAA